MTFCCRCGKEIEEPEKAWQQVIGWERRRRKGGTNHVALREPQQKWTCVECMIRLQQGFSAQQESLL